MELLNNPSFSQAGTEGALAAEPLAVAGRTVTVTAREKTAC